MKLIDLYRPIMEVGGRGLSLKDFPDDVQVAWDDFSQRMGVTHASFIERNGQIYANTKGKGWFEWDGAKWKKAEKPGPSIGSKPGNHIPTSDKRRRRTPSNQIPNAWDDPETGSNWSVGSQLFDVFSKDYAGYVGNLNRAMSRFAGKNWKQMIDQGWGEGMVDRAMKQMWTRFWTDHEAFGELMFLFDIMQRGQVDWYRRGNNNSWEIGPKYDFPARGPNWNQEEERTQRVLSNDYFDQLYGAGGGSGT